MKYFPWKWDHIYLLKPAVFLEMAIPALLIWNFETVALWHMEEPTKMHKLALSTIPEREIQVDGFQAWS